MAVTKEPIRTGWYEVWGIVLLALAVFLLLSLLSYDPGDVRFLHSPPNDPPHNFIGPLGAWMAFVIFLGFGAAGYLTPLMIGVPGVWMMFRRDSRTLLKAVWILLIQWSAAGLMELSPALWMGAAAQLNAGRPGGMFGYFLTTQFLAHLMGGIGAGIVLYAVLIVCLVLLVEVHPRVLFAGAARLWNRLIERVGGWMNRRLDAKERIDQQRRELDRKRRRLERAIEEKKAQQRQTSRAEQMEAPLEAPEPDPESEPEPKPRRRDRAKARKQASRSLDALTEEAGASKEYVLPPMDLLDDPPAALQIAKGNLQQAARVLEETLAEFNIQAEVTDIEQGPVVTRFQVLPAPGIKVERIAGLSNNIGLSLKARSVRVQAPIPGKGVVGIEVPNQKTRAVFLREVLESEAWQSTKCALPLALGHDVSGGELIGDLADMPHLLIAGATGSGKTVCMNSLLAGLLMTRTPDQLRIMLIDPKIVEFSAYAHLPHLVVPVITDAKKVALGLRWAIDEMERRYKLFAKVGVRDIKSFNARPKMEQTQLFEDDAEEPEEKKKIPDAIPYIAIIVDELADLMLVARADIEMGIARLAQLSRAVGIHMILATQRPSVNVITGTIKANFPARIAFQVAQSNDSRTILDTTGADKLLGKGDMLYLPPGSSKPVRAQGTLTKDHEIKKIVEFIKVQGEPEYVSAIKDKMDKKKVDLPEMDEDDELLESAVEIIRQTKRASTSSLQRRLRIGYTRAARLMDLLEEKGIVGPPRGSDPREILIDMDGEIPQNPAGEDESEDEEESV